MDSGSGKVVSIAKEQRTRQLPCWIESFIEITAGIPSPEIFRKWTAIATIAGALERRVHISTALSNVYANLFVLLVSPPGVGKTQTISLAMNIWRRNGKLKVAPDDITKAALLDALADSRQVEQFTVNGHQEIEVFHSLLIGADELGVLLPQHDLSFMSVMNKLFDCPSFYKETRRGRKAEEDLNMENPQTTMLAGTQPGFLASILPPEAWEMGFMSRTVMIYSGEAIRPTLFGKAKRPNIGPLIHDLAFVTKLRGEMQFSQAAQDLFVAWYEEGMKPVPRHLKLKHYNTRRSLLGLKLCMISCASRGDDLTITVEDVQRAQSWMIEAEALMPEIFKDMSGKSDALVISELHNFVWEYWIKNGKKPVAEPRIIAFLSTRTPSYNIPHIIRTCEHSRILINKGAGMWEPGEIATGFEGE